MNDIILYHCKTCGKPVYEQYGSGKYCSINCANTHKNIKRLSSDTDEIIDNNGYYHCLNCNDILNRKGKYCNNQCQADFEQKLFEDKWLSKEISGDCSSNWNTTNVRIKKYLLKKYDNACANCGWGIVNTFTGTLPLELEHIDGNPYNNSPENVTILCPNCHSLTATYRGANRGHGRKKSWIPKDI